MLRYVFGGLMVIAMASVASAGHKPGHSAGGGGGGGGSAATLGDLNCTADQIAKFNGVSGAWECAVDEIGGAAFVLLDSNDQQIGTVLDLVSVDGALVKLSVTDNFGDPHDIILNFANRTISGAGDSDVIFETTDCTGQAYNRVSNSPALWAGSTDSGLTQAITIFDNQGPDRNGVQLWIVTDTVIVPVTWRSSLYGSDGPSPSPWCSGSTGITQDAVPIELVDPDFHTAYPRPYRLELN